MSNDMMATDGQRTSTIEPNDLLRRDFIHECCVHVARVADVAAHAIALGADDLFEANIGVMRNVMRECMRTYKEMRRAN
jgi:hypothetical protein